MNDANYSIHYLGKTVTFYKEDGTKVENVLATVHVKDKATLDSIPASEADTIPPGSLAYVTGMGTVWQKGFDGTWTEVEL